MCRLEWHTSFIFLFSPLFQHFYVWYFRLYIEILFNCINFLLNGSFNCLKFWIFFVAWIEFWIIFYKIDMYPLKKFSIEMEDISYWRTFEVRFELWRLVWQAMDFQYGKKLGSFMYCGLWERRDWIAFRPFEKGYEDAKVYGF